MGLLTENSFLEVLKTAGNSGLTGIIRVEQASALRVIYFQSGKIAFASSNEKSDRLGEVLRRGGKLTTEQVEDAQRRVRPNVSLGKTLVDLGYISTRDLLWGARAQVHNIVYQLLFSEGGLYQIQEGPLPKQIIGLNLPVANIIFDGIVQKATREWILQRIGSPESVYFLSSSFYENNAAYKLPVEEVVFRMDGKRSLAEIADAASLDTFYVCKIVAAIEILGLAERLTQPTEPQKAVDEPLVVEQASGPDEVVNETSLVSKASASQEIADGTSGVQAPAIVMGEDQSSRLLYLIFFLGCAIIVGFGAAYYFKNRGQQTETTKQSALPAVQPEPVESANRKTEIETEQNSPPVTMDLVREGKVAQAASRWLVETDSYKLNYSWQLVISCQEKTIQSAFESMQYRTELMVLPMIFKGHSCYRLMYGNFASREEAEASQSDLPEFYLHQASPPHIVQFVSVLK